MVVRKLLQSVAAVAGVALCASSANAAGFITGSISIVGFFSCAFAPGTSIVSQLVNVVPSTAVAGAGFGDYAGSGGVVTAQTIVLDPLDPAYPGIQPVYTFADGTEFYASFVDFLQREALSCEFSVCSDSLEFRLVGTVKRLGFLDTSATLRWTGQGSCVGRKIVVPTCTRTPSASWSASLSSPVHIPEPATLGLLALGLIGVAAVRRRFE